VNDREEIVLPSKGKTENLVFVFHGYGASKENLLPVGEEFQNNLDSATIYLPDGFEKCDDGEGRQWFSLVDNDVDAWKKSYYEHEAELKQYVDDKLAMHDGLSYNNVILTGFSQGGMLSLMLGLKLGVKLIVGFSCQLLDPDVEINNKDTKIFFGHGIMDNVVPYFEMQESAEILFKRQIQLKIISSPYAAHGIDGYVMAGAVHYVKGMCKI
jgi:phospholipase/carboxylesterase